MKTKIEKICRNCIYWQRINKTMDYANISLLTGTCEISTTDFDKYSTEVYGCENFKGLIT